MKKISFLIAFILCIFLIYDFLYDNRVNYVSIMDNFFTRGAINYNDYIKEDLVKKNRLGTYNTSFVNHNALLIYEDLLDNRTIRINNNDYYFKKVLRESDLVIINVGMEEFSHSFDKYDINKNKELFYKMFMDIEKLITEVKKYALGKIIVLGLYNPSDYYDSNIDALFYEINDKYKKLLTRNNIIYLPLYELIKNNNYRDNNHFINSNGHLEIANLVKNYLK